MVDPGQMEGLEAEVDSPEVAKMLRSGIEAAQSGERAEARNLLLRVTDAEPDNENAWLWLASISEYPEELLVFLNNVLRVNPENERASEWAASTNSLLASNFVDRGVQAAEGGDVGYAKQCFLQALVHDEENESAWLWLASMASSEDEKRSYLGRVLRIDPDNESARKQMDDFLARESKARLMDANRLAISGGREDAIELLEEILADDPGMEDAWMLKAHLAGSFGEKIRCFERVLEINEDNQVARANLDSLKVIVESAPEFEEAAALGDADPDLHEMQSEFMGANGKWEEEDEPEAVESFASDDHEFEASPVEDEPVEEMSMDAAPAYEEVSEPDFDEAIGQPESFEELEAVEEVDERRDFVPVEEDEFLGSEPVRQNAAEACPFCGDDVDVQSFLCGSCKGVLTLSDLEMLLSSSNADSHLLEEAVSRMEAEEEAEGSDPHRVFSLGIGYINLKQYRKGYDILEGFASGHPNDVVLRSQVDALALRVAEIEQQEAEKESLPKAKTILVVDDSPTIRKLISLKLQKCGHETICAVDGVDALEKISEVVPDLVLLDITMPRMDGYQTCKMIRGNEETKDVPIVMISGKDGFFDKVRGKMAGTSNYITKPFGPETLMRTVNEYLM